MIFKELIEKITPIFLEHKFKVTDQSNNYIKFESGTIVFTFAYDIRERSFYTYFGKKESSNLIDLSLVMNKEVFNIDPLSYNHSSEIEYLIYFLTEPGLPLLKGDMELLKKAEEYSRQKNQEYNNKLMLQQKIDYLNTTWESKKYNDYIKCFEKVDKDLLPESYEKKYRIALKKINT
jgi:hypothetical protein